jgi:ribosome biogenesis GTPase / thiamine phosphate phosphatase
MSLNKGLILTGINNIFSVYSDNKVYMCEIKGKILRGLENVYNPLAAGDSVNFIIDEISETKGMIVERLERRNEFSRWNNKRNAPQTIAANIDYLICVASAGNPPFRPRFIDRVLVMAHSNLNVLIVLNKSDLGISESTRLRMENYEGMGYSYITCSAESGENIDKLKKKLSGSISAFVGQSGVGKSTLLNVLYPGHKLKTGEVSIKHDRGRHTTNHSRLVFEDRGGFIDTPGIREIELFGVSRDDLGFHFREFSEFSNSCKFQPCQHNNEPECGVIKALGQGLIHPDRYESYLRILAGLDQGGNY